MPDRITVLLVDDHALVRRGFRRIVEDDPGIVVVGEAGNGQEAIRLAGELRPKVIAMDCALPGMDGLAATRSILKTAPATAVLMLSMHSEDTWVRQALDAGARGYLLKNILDMELVTAIKRVAAGETVIDLQLSRAPTLKGEKARGLTAREIQVLQLIVEGKSNRESATKLGLSVNTVAVHRANIMETLGIHKTAELVAYAIRNELVRLP
jgi:DNA-binding NarL/FixJ family response regulator